MKIQVIAHTPMGTFHGAIQEATKEQIEQLEDLVKVVAESGNYFSLEDTGKGSTVILSSGLIQQSAFEIRKMK